MSGAPAGSSRPQPAGHPPHVKICGLTRLEDATAAHEAGADLIGAILSGGYARSIPAPRAATFVQATGLPLVAVTVDAPFAELVATAEAARASILQLHGAESAQHLARLRDAGDWELWKAVRVRDGAEIEQALDEFADVADGLLLDGWHPDQAGGAGVGFSWPLLEAVRERVPASLTLVTAGGLRPETVAEAVRRMRPDVVDVSSGVESSTGIKSPQKLRDFILHAKSSGAQHDD